MAVSADRKRATTASAMIDNEALVVAMLVGAFDRDVGAAYAGALIESRLEKIKLSSHTGYQDDEIIVTAAAHLVPEAFESFATRFPP
jgi:hypothetical protein